MAVIKEAVATYNDLPLVDEVDSMRWVQEQNKFWHFTEEGWRPYQPPPPIQDVPNWLIYQRVLELMDRPIPPYPNTMLWEKLTEIEAKVDALTRKLEQ